MASSDIEVLRAAYEAANNGDLDPLVALFTPDTVWCGPTRGHLWWSRTPS